MFSVYSYFKLSAADEKLNYEDPSRKKAKHLFFFPLDRCYVFTYLKPWQKMVFCLPHKIFGQHIAAGLPPRLVMCDLRCWPHPLTPMMDDDSSTTYERACGFSSPSFTRIHY